MRDTGHRRSGLVLAVFVLSTLVGCAGTPAKDAGPTPDPFEGMNRVFHDVNDTLDKTFLKPASDAYVAVTPGPIRDNVFNFFDNLAYPWVVINDILQGKFEQGAEDAARFVVNSTMGLGGLLDLATGFGIERHDEDLGQTLAVWGVPEGFYLELPLLGPNMLRDVPDEPLSQLTNPLFYAENVVTWPLSLLKLIDQRSRLDAAIRVRDETALDTYVFQREAYRQRRRHLIHDGDPPLDDLDLLDDAASN